MTDDPKARDRAVAASLIQSKAGAMRRLAKEWPPQWGPPPGALEVSNYRLMRIFDQGLSREGQHAMEERYKDDPARLWWVHVIFSVWAGPSSRRQPMEGVTP